MSLLPLSQIVDGVSLQGLKYPLTNAGLNLGSTRGISNVMLGAEAEIEMKKGTLLVAVSHGI